MSDSEDEHQAKLSQVLGRYKSTKGDADKRKETSKINMAKARAAKLAGLKASKESREIEVSDSESDVSSSDDEDLIITKKSKGQKGKGGRAPPAAEDRLMRMENMIMQLAQQKGKGKGKPKRKTVIHVAAAPVAAAASASVPNPKAVALKHNIIQWD